MLSCGIMRQVGSNELSSTTTLWLVLQRKGGSRVSYGLGEYFRSSSTCITFWSENVTLIFLTYSQENLF